LHFYKNQEELNFKKGNESQKNSQIQFEIPELGAWRAHACCIKLAH